MRRLGHRGFTVEIHPEVWGQVSIISRDTFRKIQDAMRQQAAELAESQPEEGDLASPVEELHLPVQGYTARCQIDLRFRSLRLMEVRPLYGTDDLES